MNPECTIFAYWKKHAFLGKSMLRAHQIRRPHSSLWPGMLKRCQKVSKGHLLTTPAQSDEWGRLKEVRETPENTRKDEKTLKS